MINVVLLRFNVIHLRTISGFCVCSCWLTADSKDVVSLPQVDCISRLSGFVEFTLR